MNYYREANAIFGFFLTVNVYFTLPFSILDRLEITMVKSSIANLVQQTSGFESLFPLMSFFDKLVLYNFSTHRICEKLRCQSILNLNRLH